MVKLKHLYRFLSARYQSVFLDYKVTVKPRYGYGLPAHAQLYGIINAHRASYALLLEKVLGYKALLEQIKDAKQESDPIQPVWNNGFLPGLDIVTLYTLLAEFKPRTYIEIGSGNSTKVAYKVKSDGHQEMAIISIDPMPRAEIDILANRVIREPFENCTYDIVEELGENDVLFVDNSHRIFPNSDAMVFFMEILPRLKKGVIVHVHDIYLPYDYPQEMCDRFYSEQYGLAMFLLANPQKYKPLLPNFFISEDKELREIVAPLWCHPTFDGVEKHGGSFWLRIEE